MALAVDAAVRAGYSYETVTRMSPRTLFAIAEITAKRDAKAVIDSATAARAGGATEESWTKFVDSVRRGVE